MINLTWTSPNYVAEIEIPSRCNTNARVSPAGCEDCSSLHILHVVSTAHGKEKRSPVVAARSLLALPLTILHVIFHMHDNIWYIFPFFFLMDIIYQTNKGIGSVFCILFTKINRKKFSLCLQTSHYSLQCQCFIESFSCMAMEPARTIGSRAQP